jgi:hypothetical protein
MGKSVKSSTHSLAEQHLPNGEIICPLAKGWGAPNDGRPHSCYVVMPLFRN